MWPNLQPADVTDEIGFTNTERQKITAHKGFRGGFKIKDVMLGI